MSSWAEKFMSVVTGAIAAAGRIMTVDYKHEDLHDGKRFFYLQRHTVASNAALVFRFTTPSVESGIFMHGAWTMHGTGALSVNLYYGTTWTTAGTLFPDNRRIRR